MNSIKAKKYFKIGLVSLVVFIYFYIAIVTGSSGALALLLKNTAIILFMIGHIYAWQFIKRIWRNLMK